MKFKLLVVTLLIAIFVTPAQAQFQPRSEAGRAMQNVEFTFHEVSGGMYPSPYRYGNGYDNYRDRSYGYGQRRDDRRSGGRYDDRGRYNRGWEYASRNDATEIKNILYTGAAIAAVVGIKKVIDKRNDRNDDRRSASQGMPYGWALEQPPQSQQEVWANCTGRDIVINGQVVKNNQAVRIPDPDTAESYAVDQKDCKNLQSQDRQDGVTVLTCR